MKALGVWLDSNLFWEHHIGNVAKACNKINMGFRLIKIYFDEQELLKLATALFYSKMYYGASVWLSQLLPVKLYKQLMATSSSVLKTITGVRCNEVDKVWYLKLLQMMHRATPLMMPYYTQATTLHSIMSTQIPEPIYEDLLIHHQDIRHHYKSAFIKNNKAISGKNIFNN